MNNSTQNKAVLKTQNRYLMLFFSAMIQLSVGVSYIWSVIQPFAMKEFGWDATTTSMTYTIGVLTFVLSGTIGGKIQDKMSPKYIVIISGILMAAGCFLATLTPASSPFFLYATYGVITGIGFGIIYNTAVTLSQKWFYDKRGMASGVVVSSLGFAGIIFAPIVNYTLTNYGFKSTFIILGVFFLLINFIISFFVKNPPKDYGLDSQTQSLALTTKQYTPKEMVKTHNFYILIFALMCGATAFILISPLLLIIGRERGLDLPVLLTGVMASSLLNAVGRLVSASLSDIIGRKQTLIGLFVLSFLSCFGLIFANGYLLVILFALLSFAYGGFFATFPALTSGLFGLKHSGSNYGLVMLGLGLASLISMLISGIIQAMGLNINYRFIASAVLAAIGILMVFVIKRPKQD